MNVQFDLTNPDGSTVPRDPTDPSLGNVKIPLPIYRPVAIGGDTLLQTTPVCEPLPGDANRAATPAPSCTP